MRPRWPFTTIDTGNPANNVIPAETSATVNIRFNDAHTSDDLANWMATAVADICQKTGIEIDMNVSVSGESFVTPLGDLSHPHLKRGSRRNRPDARAIHIGWHIGCTLREKPLSRC